jgi:hypothetical protein
MKIRHTLALPIFLTVVLTLPVLVPLNYMPVASVFNDSLSLLLWGLGVILLQSNPSAIQAYNLAAVEREHGLGCNGLKARVSNAFQDFASPAGLVLVLFAFVATFSLQIFTGAYGFISQVVGAFAMVVASCIAFDTGIRVSQASNDDSLSKSFALAVTLMGVAVSLVGWSQYLFPNLNSDWINPLKTAGRIYGNLRQPNHMALLLIWAIWATVWSIGAGHSKAFWRYLGLVLIVPVLAFTSSRMGVALLCILVPFAYFTQNSKNTLKAVGAAVCIFAASWAVADWAAQTGGLPFYGNERLGEVEATGGRFSLWSDILKILPQLPWYGCGAGQFGPCFIHSNLAERTAGVFENGHNLVLNGLVEWGWPLTVILGAWLICGFFAFFKRGRNTQAVLPAGIAFSSFIHAMLEYPWWYAYLLLPSAFCFGWMWTKSMGQKNTVALDLYAPAGRVGRRFSRWCACVLLTSFGIIYAVQYYPLRVMFSSQFFQKITPETLAKISSQAPLFTAPMSYALVISLSENVNKEDAKKLLPFFKLAGRATITPEFLARFAIVAALADEREMAKHLAWRVINFDKARLPLLKSQVASAQDPALDWFQTYLRSPIPVNLDRSVFAN